MFNCEMAPTPRATAEPAVNSLQGSCSCEDGHFVQFYEDDQVLVDSVGAFVAAGFNGGEAGIVIATAAHRRAIENVLEQQGIDISALRARGRYISLDAADTLSKFMRDGLPVPALFKVSIGRIVAQAARQGAVRAFGEMVALLWAEGNGEGAIRLEELWNELRQEYPFTLFCAYPMKGLKGAVNGEQFARICERHSRVIPAESYARFPADERAGAMAILQQKAASLESEIQARKVAEADSRLLGAIVESSDDAIVSKDLNSIITSWNKGAEQIFGYRADEVIGKSITLLMPPGHEHEERIIIGRILRQERIEHYETIRRRKDGTLVPVSLSVSPVKDAAGNIVGAAKIARDISDRKRIEKELESVRARLASTNEELEQRVGERTASLQEAIAQMEEFSYTVSHDLRAPLRGMQIYSEALLEDYARSLAPEAQHCLERIAEGARRLDKMVLDVLTLSRLSRGEVRIETISLDKLVRDLIQHYPEMQPPRADIKIEPLIDVRGHEASLTQAVSNLLSNAVKFVAPLVLPSVRVWTEERGQNVRLWIEDNGIGIAPQYQNRLFRMFERIHPKLKYDGTGVGLAIVRKATARMGGDAGVESDGLSGSRFWIELPGAQEIR